MRPCQNCGKPIGSLSRAAKFCSNGCRTIAYRKRNGIASPDFLEKRKRAFLSPDEERDVHRLQLEIDSYESVMRLLEEEHSKWHKALLLFEAYGDSDRGYQLDGTSRAIGKKEIQRILGVSDLPYYGPVKDKVNEGSKRIAVLEKELLVRQRKVYKILDSAKAREVVRKAQKSSFVGSDLLKMKYDVLPFEGDWKELVGEPTRNFYGLTWGDAKAGKSYVMLRLAQYLTQFGNVAYIATEEGISQTMQTKVADVKAVDVQIIDTRELSEIAKQIVGSQFVFIDSATKIDLTPDDVSFLRESYPETAFMILLQSVKKGANFKGDQKWKHDAEFVIQVTREGKNKTKATCEGRFGSGSIEYNY